MKQQKFSNNKYKIIYLLLNIKYLYVTLNATIYYVGILINTPPNIDRFMNI